MNAEHDPLPWYEYNEGDMHFVGSRLEPEFKTSTVDVCRICPADKKTMKANAKFIVRACNSHYELIQALERANAFLNSEKIKEAWYYSAQGISQEIKAVIAKAKGEA